MIAAHATHCAAYIVNGSTPTGRLTDLAATSARLQAAGSPLAAHALALPRYISPTVTDTR